MSRWSACTVTVPALPLPKVLLLIWPPLRSSSVAAVTSTVPAAPVERLAWLVMPVKLGDRRRRSAGGRPDGHRAGIAAAEGAAADLAAVAQLQLAAVTCTCPPRRSSRARLGW